MDWSRIKRQRAAPSKAPGVYADLTGSTRPADGTWTAGAVEAPQ